MKKRILLFLMLLSLSVFLLSSCDSIFGKKTEIVFDYGNTETKSYTVKDFSELEIPSDPKRDGYVFDGWYFDEKYTEAFSLTTLFTKEAGGKITVYAKWMSIGDVEFKYEFYLDGKKSSELTVKGTDLPSVNVPKKNGYAFYGWYLDAEFQNEFSKEDISAESAGAPIKLYAKMVKLADCEFTLRFMVDGQLYSKVLTDGVEFMYPTEPEKQGYTFGGWYLDEKFSEQLSADALLERCVKEQIFVYAKFTQLPENVYTLIFYLDGKQYSKLTTDGTDLTYPSAPEKTGYYFDGWYFDESFEDTFTVDKLLMLSADEPISLYAKMVLVPADECSVSFYVNGVLYKTSYTTGGKLTLPEAPKKENHTFVGWFYDIAFKYEFDEDDTIDENKSLYAKFEPKKVIATLKNGNDVDSVKITYGESYKLTSFPDDTVIKKRFLGWVEKGSNTLLTDEKGNSLGVSTFTSDVTLVAVWSYYDYNVVFDVEGEKDIRYIRLESISGEEIYPASEIPADPTPTKEGYVFDGWYTEKTGGEKVDFSSVTFSRGDYVTYYARFVKTTIEFITDSFHVSFVVVFTEDYGGPLTETEIYRFFNNEYGVNIHVTDDSSRPSACELIVGNRAQGRGEECSVDTTSLGHEGYIIKTVGDRVIIAGGSDEATKAAFLKLVSDYIIIEYDEHKIPRSLSVKRNVYYEHKTEYDVESISIGGVDLSEFKLCVSSYSSFYGNVTERVRRALYEASGYYLEWDYGGSSCSCEHHIRIGEYNADKDTNGDGFVLYVEGGNMYIGTLFDNSFEKAALKFIDKYITSATGNVAFNNGFLYTDRVCEVRYEDYGAVGDGVTDDFAAIASTHLAANSNGYKVVGTKGAKYYIGSSFTHTIEIETDVDFGGAEFIIDDVGSTAYSNRHLYLFTVTSPSGNWDTSFSIGKGDKEIYGLGSYLSGFSAEKFMVIVYSSEYIYEKYLSESSTTKGFEKSECFIIDKKGNILNGDTAYFDFYDISYVKVYPYIENEITVANGTFKTIRARADVLTEGEYSTSYSYNRGILIHGTANVTLENINHDVINEPSPINDASRLYDDVSFAYTGFIQIRDSYGITLKDCKLDAHTEYYRYSVSGSQYGTPIKLNLPSHDLFIQSSSRITLDGVSIYNSDYLTDTKYSNVLLIYNSKYIEIKNSVLNAMDAIGLHGATIQKTTIGRVIELVGGGELVFDEVVRVANKSFLTLKGECGALFNGNITFKNCEMKGEKTYNSNTESKSSDRFVNLFLITSEYKAGNSAYASWECSLERTMPYTVTVEGGLTVNSGAKAHVFADISDSAFDKSYDALGEKAYVVTKKVIFKNMNRLAITNGSGTVLNSIKVEDEE